MAAPGIPAWQQTLLQRIGAPPTTENLTFLNSWQRAEGGDASNNPFNTTQPGYHTTGNYNSVGVKSYATPQDGLNATVATLQNGRYGNILQALKQGKSAKTAAEALANSPWGTGALVLKMLGGHTTPPPGGGNVTSKSLAQASLSQPPPDNRAGLMQYLMGNLNSYAQTGVASNPQGLMALIGSQQQASPSPNTTPTSKTPMPTQGVTAPYKGGSTVGWLEHFANPYGLTVTSTTGDQHATHSYHYQGRAVDFGGDPTKMAALAKSALSNAGNFKEFIYTGPGNPGYSILDGKVIPNTQLGKHLYDQHTNHVHLAR